MKMVPKQRSAVGHVPQVHRRFLTKKYEWVTESTLSASQYWSSHERSPIRMETTLNEEMELIWKTKTLEHRRKI